MKKKLLFLIPAFVGMSVFTQAQQKVGVNTDNPKATLDINGNMAIENVREAKPGEKVSTLYWDRRDKQVKRVNTPDDLFYVLDYRVECTKDGDYSQKNQWVSDFDTKIPADKFSVLFGRVYPVYRDYQYSEKIDILHAGPTLDTGGYKWRKDNDGPQIQVMDYGYAEKRGKTTKYDLTYHGSDDNFYFINPVLRKVLYKKDGTWHFTVGYPGARPDSSYHTGGLVFEWQVQLIAISNSISGSKDIGEVSVDKREESKDKNPNTIDVKNSPL